MSQDHSAIAPSNTVRVSFVTEGIAKVNLKCMGKEDSAEVIATLRRVLGYLSQDFTVWAIIMIIVGPNQRYTTETQPQNPKHDIIEPLKLGKPVVSVLQSSISNKLALDLACSSDIRICTADALFQLGYVPGREKSLEEALKDMPPALRLLDSISLFSELLMAGNVVTAEDAHRLGFVSRVLKTEQEAIHQAQRLVDDITLSEQRTSREGFHRGFVASGGVENLFKL